MDLIKIQESIPSVSLLSKNKKTFYSNLNEKKITDTKTFWKTVKLFLSDKTPSDEKKKPDWKGLDH